MSLYEICLAVAENAWKMARWIVGIWFFYDIFRRILGGKSRYPESIYHASGPARFDLMRVGLAVSLYFLGSGLWEAGEQRDDLDVSVSMAMAGIGAFTLGFFTYRVYRRRRAFERTYDEGAEVDAKILASSIVGMPEGAKTTFERASLMTGPWRPTIRFEIGGQMFTQTRRIPMRGFQQYGERSRLPILVRAEDPGAWIPRLDPVDETAEPISYLGRSEFPAWIYTSCKVWKFEGALTGSVVAVVLFGVGVWMAWEEPGFYGCALILMIPGGIGAIGLGYFAFQTGRRQRALERTYLDGEEIEAEVVASKIVGLHEGTEMGPASISSMVGPWLPTIRFEIDGRVFTDTQRVPMWVYSRYEKSSQMPILVRREEPEAWLPAPLEGIEAKQRRARSMFDLGTGSGNEIPRDPV